MPLVLLESVIFVQYFGCSSQRRPKKTDNKLITLGPSPGFSQEVVVGWVIAKEAIQMAKKRANGEGNIRKRKDGRWEGRYTAGYDSKTGKRLIKNVLGKTQAEVKCIDVARSEDYTVATWLRAVDEALRQEDAA